MKITPQDYSVYLCHTGCGNHQLFIKNVSADADFIRVITGYAQMTRDKRTGTIMNQWIITPLRPENEHVHLGNIARRSHKSQRLWVAFEAVKRGKKNVTVGVFAALSPPPSSWRTKVGALTYLDIVSSDKIEIDIHQLEPLLLSTFSVTNLYGVANK